MAHLPLVSNFSGYRLAMSSQYDQATSLQAYKGIIAKVMIALDLAFKQEFLDDKNQVVTLAINKKSLGHHVWRHNRYRELAPKKYRDLMVKSYQVSHHRFAENFSNHRYLTQETSSLMNERNLFSKGPMKLKEFIDHVHKEAPLKGNFYKIKKEGKTVGYLLGTIHSGNELVTNLNPQINKALKKAQVIACERAFDDQTPFTPRNDLKEKYARFAKEHFQAIKTAKLESKFGIEDCLSQIVDKEKEVVALETIEEKDESLNLLLEEANESEKISPKEISESYRNVLTGKETSEKEYEKYQKECPRSLSNCHARSQRMTERAEPLMQRGRTFIAVGDFHLHGKEGMRSLFESKGYKLKKV